MSPSTPTRPDGITPARASPWSRAARFISDGKAPGQMAETMTWSLASLRAMRFVSMITAALEAP